jgi:ribokinase
VDATEVIRRDGTATALIVEVVDRHGQWRYLEDIPETDGAHGADVDSATGALRDAATVSVQLSLAGEISRRPDRVAVGACER